jgi:hypothetical protein
LFWFRVDDCFTLAMVTYFGVGTCIKVCVKVTLPFKLNKHQ